MVAPTTLLSTATGARPPAVHQYLGMEYESCWRRGDHGRPTANWQSAATSPPPRSPALPGGAPRDPRPVRPGGGQQATTTHHGGRVRRVEGVDFILGRSRSSTRPRGSALGDSQRALLGLLLIHANETLSTERLADELWGDSAPASATKTGSGPSVAAPQGAARPPRTSRHAGMATSFRSTPSASTPAVSSGSSKRKGPSWPAAARIGGSSRSASRSRRGTLADLAYEPFAQAEIGRLEELRLTALEQLIEARLRLGRHGEVVPQLEALVAEHPIASCPGRS